MALRQDSGEMEDTVHGGVASDMDSACDNFGAIRLKPQKMISPGFVCLPTVELFRGFKTKSSS
jgi:hypothetical protein